VANSSPPSTTARGQVECTVNGIGERAGNAALEEIAMGLKTRSDFYGASRPGFAREKSSRPRRWSRG